MMAACWLASRNQSLSIVDGGTPRNRVLRDLLGTLRCCQSSHVVQEDKKRFHMWYDDGCPLQS